MWFSREQFEICYELKQWGLEPRFEPGDVVARGFADLGFEEFQVLPGSKLLSLTAGTVSSVPAEQGGHFFWIPSVDEITHLLETIKVPCISCTRVEQREWRVELQHKDELEACIASSLHLALLRALRAAYRRMFREA